MLIGNTTNNAKDGYRRGNSEKTKEPYIPKDKATGEPIRVDKTKAGNSKIDAEAKGNPHTQLRQDATGNYAQKITFDSKGRKRVDTHFTTHGEPGKANPHMLHIIKMDAVKDKIIMNSINYYEI